MGAACCFDDDRPRKHKPRGTNSTEFQIPRGRVRKGTTSSGNKTTTEVTMDQLLNHTPKKIITFQDRMYQDITINSPLKKNNTHDFGSRSPNRSNNALNLSNASSHKSQRKAQTPGNHRYKKSSTMLPSKANSFQEIAKPHNKAVVFQNKKQKRSSSGDDNKPSKSKSTLLVPQPKRPLKKMTTIQEEN
jgi:hypothetical protein